MKNIGRIEHVADIIASYKPHPVVVVVSAMGDTTDHLLNLARQCSVNPDQRELDLLLSTGEQVLNCPPQSHFETEGSVG